ncbi:MAG: hypothetical protein N4A44_01065 [Alphaproteobacteria bacterium]|jgi:F0F1-type ATP synthase assembly protein I|nr:hypothetical protein [Alphaproteobacteria bacterium]
MKKKEKRLRAVIKDKINSKSRKKRPVGDLHEYNILGEIGFGLALPIVIALFIGHYYSCKHNDNYMLTSILIGLGVGLINTFIITRKELKQIDKNRAKRIANEQASEEKK